MLGRDIIMLHKTCPLATPPQIPHIMSVPLDFFQRVHHIHHLGVADEWD